MKYEEFNELSVKQKTKNENEDIMTKTIKFCIENSFDYRCNDKISLDIYSEEDVNLGVYGTHGYTKDDKPVYSQVIFTARKQQIIKIFETFLKELKQEV